MFRNYLAAALRNITRNKLYAAINIVGLSVGFAAALLIALFVRDELSYETWIPGYAQVYHVDQVITLSGQGPREYGATGLYFADQLRLAYPSVASVARAATVPAVLRHGDTEANEQMAWADPDFFTVLPLPAIAGDLKTALADPAGIVLTRRMALKYFGRPDPIGESLELNRTDVFQVKAVLKDLPANTHIGTEIFASSRSAASSIAVGERLPPEREKGNNSLDTYFRLSPGVRIGPVPPALNAYLQQQMDIFPGVTVSARFVPLAAIHFQAGVSSYNISGPEKLPESLAMVYSVAAVGALIIVGVAINFINLMTARAARRAIEVGVRKVSGALRRDLIIQFLGESLVYVAIGVVIATGMLEALLPAFAAFLRRDLSAASGNGAAFWLAVFGIAALIGLGAGFYPAFVLSSFRPAAIVKTGAVKRGSSNRLRQALVITQFAILIGLILSTAIIARQNSFALNEGMRFDQDRLLVISGAKACSAEFRNSVQALSGVRALGCSRYLPTPDGNTSVNQLDGADGRKASVRWDVVDFGLFELLDLHPVAGRFFARENGLDSVSAASTADAQPDIVINETAARMLGYASPGSAVGQAVSWQRQLAGQRGVVTDLLPSQIIGVVPDFVLDSVHEKIEPAMFYVDEGFFRHLDVKLNGKDIPETLAAIDRLWKQAASYPPISRTFVDQYTENLYLDLTRQSQAFTLFAAVALFVSVLGLFGLSAFTAETRTKEIGIRKAMGASKADILRLILWEFTKPVLWANVIAWPVGYFVMHRWLEGFAYHVDLSPWIFLAASALALGIAVVTVTGHALLIARSQPVTALRYE